MCQVCNNTRRHGILDGNNYTVISCVKGPNLTENDLVFRRLRGDMIEIFKIMAGIYGNEVTPAIPKGNEHQGTLEKKFH